MSLEKALAELGIGIVRQDGDEWWAHCPYPRHVDRNPSWSINSQTMLHNCFSCGYRGGIIGLVADRMHLSMIGASKWCRSKGVRPTTLDLDRHSLDIVPISEASLAVFTAPPEEECAKRRFSPIDARTTGVLWHGKNAEWVCPVRDPWSHELWGWQFKFTKEKGFRNYPAGVKKSLSLFGIDAFTLGSRAIIVESPLDVTRLYAAGVEGGLSTWGATLSEAQLRILLTITDEIIFFYDNDEAGAKARKQAADMVCTRPGIKYKFADYDFCDSKKDPGDLEDDEIWEVLANAYRRLKTVRTSLL